MAEEWLKKEVSEPFAYFESLEIPIDEIIEKIAEEYRNKVGIENEEITYQNIGKEVTKEVVSRLEGIVLKDRKTLRKNMLKISSLLVIYIQASPDIQKYKNFYDFLAELQHSPNLKK